MLGKQPVICNLVQFLFLNIAVLGYIFDRPIGTVTRTKFSRAFGKLPTCDQLQAALREAAVYAHAYCYSQVVKIQLLVPDIFRHRLFSIQPDEKEHSRFSIHH